jgi:RHS repeat-associated protein
VDTLSYTNLGEPLQYTVGTSSLPAYITDSYDPQTRRLTEQNTQTGTGQTSVDDMHYGYDHSGNITTEADTPAGASSATDVQCFGYDYLARLVQAWAQGAAGCAATPSASAEGGPAPYWNSYNYNAIGNLTGITATAPSGAVTTTTGSYPAAGAARPHAITTAAVTGPSGTTSTSYGYDASGNLTTVGGPSQSQALTWDDAGRLTQDAVTPSGGSAHNTGYIDDASGALLLEADPGTTTLYLPDEELSLNTTSGTVTGTRYYSLAGITVAARTGATTLAYLTGDQEGTDSVAIDASALTVTRRYYDPYGNPRGVPVTNFPAGQRGFVGGTADTATGLTDLGVREYQPATGSFISPDPAIKPYDPQNLNAYGYAGDNPSSQSDPNGAMVLPGQGSPSGGDGPAKKAPVSKPSPNDPTTNKPKGKASSPATVVLSPHVVDATNDPELPALKADWQWVIAHYGKPKNAKEEFDDWWHACSIGPHACTGQFGADFRATPNFAIETAWWSGIKLGLGNGGNIEGYFVPLLAGGVASSKILGRNLVAAGYAKPPESAAHHIVAGGKPDAKEARDILDQFGVDINDAANGVWLPRFLSSANPYDTAVHSKVHSDDYYRNVNSRVRAAKSREELVEIIDDIRAELLAGDTVSEEGGGADAGGGGE